MKQVYSHVTVATGAQAAGICQVKIGPREWLLADPIIDFETGKVLTPVSFIAGRNFLTLQFTQDSYDYSQKTKSSKAGDFYEIAIGGSLNKIDADLQQVLESLRYHELIAVVKDRRKALRLVGNASEGLRMKIAYKNANNSGGNEIGNIDLVMESEAPPPFYEV